MSSNIVLQKSCEFCGNAFTARTLVTRYCSKKCNSKHYKLLARQERIKSHGVHEINLSAPNDVLRNASHEYFEVGEAAEIMRISPRTLYRLIALKKLKKKKLMSRTVILKDDIRFFLLNNKP